jgi:rfaE bifunctional protein nucleotidyltransferase chain/domain
MCWMAHAPAEPGTTCQKPKPALAVGWCLNAPWTYLCASIFMHSSAELQIILAACHNQIQMSTKLPKTTQPASNRGVFTPGTNSKDRYITDFDRLDEVVKAFKTVGLKVVLTQGVYDLIHEGHARYLEMAKSYGDILIVGVDSDELTRERKGKNRPIVPEKERVEMLIHLRHVDVVVLRNTGQDIGDLIRLVKPDVLVTSTSTKDFTAKLVNDYQDYTGEIVMLDPQSTTSTTARIRDLTIEGAENLATEIDALTKDFIAKIRNA